MGLAAIAYCRTVLHSNVRDRLTDYVAVPEELVDLHSQVKIYRNATVAHSQSELAVTYAVVGLLGIFAPDTFGLMPIGGNDIWLHLATAAVLYGATFLEPSSADLRTRV